MRKPPIRRTSTLFFFALSLWLLFLQACFPTPNWRQDPTYSPNGPPPPEPTEESQSSVSTASPAQPAYLTADGAASRHDSLTLGQGFYPDPYSVPGLSGGTIDASYLGNTAYGACLGYTQASPSHLLTLTTPIDTLRAEVSSGAHLTLLVLGPDGWRCNADTRSVGQGGSPAAVGGSWPAGTYRVWVGSYGQTVPYDYNLSLSGGPFPSTPSAQDVATELDLSSYMSRYATLALTRGFMPDPQAVTGLSGGAIDAAYLGNSRYGPCRGATEAEPNHVMTLLSPFDYLRFDVMSQGDTTLLIHGPDGWRCNDDSSGPNPQIEGSWQVGAYQIWVGSYQEGSYHPYTITATTAGAQITQSVQLDDQTYSSRYQSLRLLPGFQPDPLVMTGITGAHQPVDVSYLGQTPAGPCRGVADREPNHIVNLTAPFSYLRLAVESQGDTTLVVQGPQGWLCNDDSNGLDPGIDGEFSAGLFRIWVGSYRAGEQYDYNLSISARSRTADVPHLDPTGGAYRPRDESLSLAVGFSPDPQEIEGLSGGSMAASSLGGSQTSTCGGYTELPPNHLIHLDGDFPYLRLDVRSEGDTTLVVHGPEGWLCDDDTAGEDPRLEGAFTSGTYRVWVGSARRIAQHEYSLTVTQQPLRLQIHPSVRPTLRPQARSSSLSLTRGFLPDPQTVTGQAGGHLDGSQLGGSQTAACNGFTETMPSHVVTLQSDFNYLRFEVDSDGDTTLLVEGPDGWFCDDDTVGLDPRIEGPFRRGTYRLWVGSYYPSTYPSYTLSVSEFPQ